MGPSIHLLVQESGPLADLPSRPTGRSSFDSLHAEFSIGATERKGGPCGICTAYQRP